MGLSIFIGEVEVDDGALSIHLLRNSPVLLSQYEDSHYANYWSMSYSAQELGCKHYPWFKEAIGSDTCSTPKPLVDVPAPYGEIPYGWEHFVEWFTFWREYALNQLKYPVIRLG